MMVSSTRLRNSGLKVFFKASLILPSICAYIESESDFWKPNTPPVPTSRLPALEVIISTVLQKSTLRPVLSVSRPLVENLQQDVEDIGMGLLDLV